MLPPNSVASAERHLADWNSVALPHEDVAAAGQTLIGRELIAPPYTHLIKPSPPVFSKLVKLDKAVRQLAEAAPEVLAGAEVVQALEQTLIRVMIQCLSEGQEIEVGNAYWRHVAVMRRLENFLEANPDRTLHLTDLCEAAAASDRTLRILCGASRDEPDTLSFAAADASGPAGSANGRSDDGHRHRDSHELCFLGIGPLRGGLSLAIWRATLGNAAAPARRPTTNFRFALAAS